MILKDIRELARQQGIKNYSKLKKAELIRTIQTREGNVPCFETKTDCREEACLWWSDCRA